MLKRNPKPLIPLPIMITKCGTSEICLTCEIVKQLTEALKAANDAINIQFEITDAMLAERKPIAIKKKNPN